MGEIDNLHHLLNGYNSILYRFHLSHGKKLIKILGRPDRIRSKYSTDEAKEKLQDVDEIFPMYQNYFNVSDARESRGFEEILNDRVHNIENTLETLEQDFNSSGGRKLVNLTSFLFMILSNLLT